ncbi:hypothetical protein SLS58_011165 [Diplodia intermedia]|uniref:Arrestin-like N-terminal domain-containing protein n=1 Tax=Diplodia intermedia TaxID=856260 RepID=A0ABR3T135_9PEZI
MDIQIFLNPHGQIITTGDVITGRVLLSARRKVNVSAIDVRLRGYIRTSLLAEDDTNPETWKPYHAQHEHGFPFQFRGGDLLEKLNAATRSYDERGLPPSFKSDEIEIVYCIEATATRPDLFKENLHTTHAFNFRPIEQSRDPAPELTSIKHQHQFDLQKPPSRPSSNPTIASPTRDLATILIDFRLPAPAILTRNRPAPLSLTIRKDTAFTGQLYLRSLHVGLIGYTGVQKTHSPPSLPRSSSVQQQQQQQQQRQKKRKKADTCIIASRSNLRAPIGRPDARVGARMALPAALWSGRAVPAAVAPSFDVLCRGDGVIVTRSYELEVTLGLAYEAEEQQQQGEDGNNGGDDEVARPPAASTRTVWLPLRRRVEVYADFPGGGGVAAAAAAVDASSESCGADGLHEKDIADGYDRDAQSEEYVPARPVYERAPTYEVATASPHS